MKLSHSALSTLQTCGQKFKYSYIHKLKSVWESSALKFGSAIDAALNHMLLNREAETVLKDSILIFEQEWVSQKNRDGTTIYLETNPYLKYSDSDFDKDLLDEHDLRKIEMIYTDWEPVFNAIKTKKKVTEWKDISEKDRCFYNFVNWLSLKQKGRILIEAYHRYILPEIAEVLDVQKHISIDNGSGSILHGYVDFVIRMKDGSVVVMDNKTSSIEYKQDSATYSPQLTLYMIMLNSMDLQYKVDKVGYAVLRKGILKKKTKTCKSCNYQAEDGTTHKTCNNKVEEKRCGGEWKIEIKKDVDFQFIVSTPPEKFQEDLLTNVNMLNKMVENGIFIKNYGACVSNFGECEYAKICRGKLEQDPELTTKD